MKIVRTKIAEDIEKRGGQVIWVDYERTPNVIDQLIAKIQEETMELCASLKDKDSSIYDIVEELDDVTEILKTCAACLTIDTVDVTKQRASKVEKSGSFHCSKGIPFVLSYYSADSCKLPDSTPVRKNFIQYVLSLVGISKN